MLQAVESPLLKVAAVAGAAGIVAMLALGSSSTTCGASRTAQRLVLHAPEAENAIYLTAWRNGDVHVWVPDGERQTITFQTRARVWDGCQWLATETLVPSGPDLYMYSYEETVLSCEPGATPTSKTPRTGFVVSLPTR